MFRVLDKRLIALAGVAGSLLWGAAANAQTVIVGVAGLHWQLRRYYYRDDSRRHRYCELQWLLFATLMLTSVNGTSFPC